MPQLERPQTDLDPGAVFQINTSVKSYNPERKDVTNVKPLLTDMVVIPGGTKFGEAMMETGMKCQGITLPFELCDRHSSGHE